MSQASPAGARPAVSIIVPCRNEERFIGPCVRSIIASGYPREKMEVLVVDGMSSDGTRAAIVEAAAGDPRVRVVDNPKLITAAAFNTGIKASTGEVVMILGAHSGIGPDYVARCVAALDETGADNVGGVLRTVPRGGGFTGLAVVRALTHPFGVGNARFRSGTDRPIEVDTVFGGCYRRKALERTGPFNEGLTFSQDMEFNLRFRKAGGRILLVPGIETTYYARTGLGEFLRHNWRNGEWAVLPFAYSPIVPVSPRHLVPLAFVMSLIMAAVAGMFWKPALLLAAGIIAAYLAAALAASAQIAARERDPRYILVMPLMFAGLHITYGLGSLWGALRAAAVIGRRGRPRA